ncbi:MAG: hypothetical protein IJY47_06880 [Clostridia bacterium]|nr:hypothetical protein [Clostridia bacterium]
MKRILCLALVLLMLLPMAVACKKENEKVDASTTGVADDTTNSGPVDLLDTIPAGNYNGKEFVISVQDAHELEVKASELTGDLKNDTVYYWLEEINSRYGVQVLSQVPDGNYWTHQVNETSSGNVTTSIYGHHAFELHRPVSSKIYKNWNDMGDYIDLEAERWDKTINDGITWSGVFFGLSGDLGYSKLQGAMATFCNVGLLDEIGYTTEDLYKMVDEKTWTFEAFENIVKDIYIDTDYDNKKSAGDTFGYVATSGNSHDIWFTQFGISITEKDESNNTITPTLKNDHNIDLIEKLWAFYHENQGVFSNNGVKAYGPEDRFFSEGRAAMITTRLSYASQFSEDLGTDAYGILPAPLQNEDQEEYYTKLYDEYMIWGVSKSVLDADVDFIAHITDALCAESSQTLYPAFYDILLKQRYSKDPDTARMVDLVMKNVSIDSTFIYNSYLDTYATLVRNLLWVNSSPEFTSSYARFETSLPQKLADLYKLHEEYH